MDIGGSAAPLFAEKEGRDHFVNDFKVVAYSSTIQKFDDNYTNFNAKYTIPEDSNDDSKSIQTIVTTTKPTQSKKRKVKSRYG